jgi:hypothetical protein
MSRQLDYYHRDPEARNAATRERRTTPRGRAAYMVCTCRSRAKKRGFEFDLTSDWIEQRLKRGCELTGLPFDLEAGARDLRSPSVDRIDSTQGYTQENCRVILWGLNCAFSTWGDDAFQEIASAWLGVIEQNINLEPAKAAK